MNSEQKRKLRRGEKATALRVAYYISSHGFGHATRAAQVIAALPRHAAVYVKTMAPHDFLLRETGRVLQLSREAFDFGAWQASNMQIDWDRTFEVAMKIHAESRAHLNQEIDFLRRERIDVVVCDIPPTPLLAAKQANIPSICVANFTWVEVYRKAAGGHAYRERFLRTLAQEYATASVLLRPGFAVSMRHFREHHDVAPIARKGKNIRRDLLSALRLPARTQLALTYLGKWGFGELNIERAARFLNVAFLSFDSEAYPLHKLDAERWKFEDVIASVDVVIAKPGYGTLSECMANGVPVIYYPRCEFAEYFALRRDLDRWGGAVRLSKRQFVQCRWGQALEKALQLRPKKVRCTGAEEIAQWIIRLARNR